MGPGTVVRVRNLDAKEFTDSWNNSTWRIPPQGENIVPFEAMCLWFGHPEAIDIDPRNMFRHEEHMRMRTKYGVYEDDSKEASNFPKVEVMELDGTPITTVIHDPEGTTLSPQAAHLSEQRAIQEQMAEMQRQLETMRAYINTTQGEGAVPVPQPQATPDAPPVPPASTPAIITEGDPGIDGVKSRVEVLEDSPGATRVRVG